MSDKMSMLEMLQDQRIFKIIKQDDVFFFQECCDDCFDVFLTKDEYKQLLKEMLDLL